MISESGLILSDGILSAILKFEADAVGVTLEEYVDRFLEVFYNEQGKLISIIANK